MSSVESITLDTISYNENSSTELAGRARLDNTVRIYLNNDLESEVKVNDSGAWRVSLSDIKAGVYTLRLDEVNENGTVEGRLELPFKRKRRALIQAMGEGSITATRKQFVEIVENTMERGYNMSKYLREIPIL